MEWYEKWPYKQIGFDDVEQKNIKVNMCECCIAFIDILGFKSMVKNNIEKVILALRYIKMFRDSFYKIPSRMGNPERTEVMSEPDEEVDELELLRRENLRHKRQLEEKDMVVELLKKVKEFKRM